MHARDAVERHLDFGSTGHEFMLVFFVRYLIKISIELVVVDVFFFIWSNAPTPPPFAF